MNTRNLLAAVVLILAATVHARPVITPFADVTACRNEQAEFVVTIDFSTAVNPVIAWRFSIPGDGTLVPLNDGDRGGRVSIVNDFSNINAVTSTLTIDDTDFDIDGGTYRIEARTDNFNTVSADAVLDFYTETTVTPEAEPNVICLGDITQLTSNPTDSGVDTPFVVWRIDEGPSMGIGQFDPNPAQIDVDFEPNSSGIYQIEAAIADGFCDAEDAEIVTVTVHPRLEANPGPDEAITCENGTIPLDANPAGGSGIYTYNWSIVMGPNPNLFQFSSTKSRNPDFMPADLGTYELSVEVTDEDCIGMTTETMTVNVSNTVEVTAVTDQDNICLGGSTEIMAEPVPSNGFYEYTWSITQGPDLNPIQLDDAGAQTVVFTPSTLGSYTLRVSAGGGLCGDSDNITIVVRQGTDVAPSSTLNTLCVSETTQLFANPVGGSQEGQTFEWTIQSGPNFSNGQFSNRFSPNPTFTPFAVGDYMLRVVITDNVCDASNDATIAITSTAIIASAPTPETASTCVDDGIMLQANPSGGLETYTFDWSIVEGPSLNIMQFDDPTSETPTFTPTSPTAPGSEYVIELIVSGPGCDDAEPQEVSISVTNAITLDATADSETICVGSDTRVRANSSNAQASVIWSIDPSSPDTDIAQIPNPSSPNPRFFPTMAGTYTLNVNVSGGGCDSAADSVVVEVLEEPGIDPTPSAENTCVGEPIDLAANHVGSDMVTFFWEILSGPDTNASQLANASMATATFTPNAAGTYEFQLTLDDKTCDQFISDMIEVEVLSPLTSSPDTEPSGVASACVNLPLQLHANPVGGDGTYTYLWSIAFQPPNSTGMFDNDTIESPTFTAEGATGQFNYQLQVVVFDETCEPADTSVLTLAVSPPITIEPNIPDAIVVEGGIQLVRGVPFNIDAQATGGGDVHYQWSIVTGPNLNPMQFEGGTQIPNPTFTPAALGFYRIRLVADDGVCTPVTVEIEFESTEGIISQATADSEAICMGESVQLNAAPMGGNGDYSYAWTITSGDNDPMQFSETDIVNPIFTPNDVGDYVLQVEITENELPPGIGTIDLSVVAEDFVINDQPQSTEVCAGDDAVFTVGLADDTGVTYQWKYGAMDIPGANEPVLVIENTSSANAGGYVCTITGPCNTGFTQPAMLDVLPPIVQDPVLAAINLGGNPELNQFVTGCTLTGGIEDAFSGDLEDVGRIVSKGQIISRVTGLAYDPTDSTVYASVQVPNVPPTPDTPHYLARVQQNTGSATLVGEFGQPIFDLAIHPDGTLFAITGTDLGAGGRIYTVNKNTGKLTETEIPVFANEFGHTIACDSQGWLYHHGMKPGQYSRLTRIDLASPQATPVIVEEYTSDQAGDWTALAMRDDLVLVSTASTGELWSLDPATFAATELGPIRSESGASVRAEGIVFLDFTCGLGDGDCDGVVSLDDFAEFMACVEGIAISCNSFDANGDGEITLTDFGAFQRTFTGP